MEQFAESVVKFLEFNEYNILKGKGNVSKTIAEMKASKEYEEYNKIQPIESDFDLEIKELIYASKNNKKIIFIF